MFFLSVWKWHFNLAKLSKNKDEVDCKQKKEKDKGNIFDSPQIFFLYQKYEKVCFVLNIYFFYFLFFKNFGHKIRTLTHLPLWREAACCTSEMWWSELQRGRRQRAESFC